VFPFFSSNLKLDEYYQKLVPLFLTKNDIIYQEKGKADSLYLIYSGECLLKKNFKNKLNFDYFSVKNMKTVLQLTHSQVGGLESLYKDIYDQTLIANSDYTIVFKINLADFSEFKACFKNLYDRLYEERQALIKGFTKNHLVINEKLKIHYRSHSAVNFELKKKREEEQLKDLNNIIDKVKGHGQKRKKNEVPMKNIKFLPTKEEQKHVELPGNPDLIKSFVTCVKPQSSCYNTITTGITSSKTSEKKTTTNRNTIKIKPFITISENEPGLLKSYSFRGTKKHFKPIQKENEIFTLNTGTFNLPMISMIKK
jgi:hypothetical protein